MKGHTRKRGTFWTYVLDVGRDENGRRVQRWKSGFTTKRDAEKALAEALSRLGAGTYVEPSKLTLAGYLAEWLAGQKGKLRPSTFASYKMCMESHVTPRLGTVGLQRLTAPTLNAFYADLLEAGRRDGKGGLHPRSVRYIHMILRKALADAVRANLTPRNVGDMADPPRPRAAKEMHTWSPEELRAFLAHVQGDRLYAAYLTAATTGLRRGELLGLRWKDVDLETGRLAIRQTLLSIGWKMTLSTPKTAKGKRSVALDPTTIATLRAHRKAQLEERLAWGAAWEDDGLNKDLVFRRENGAAIHPDSFCDAFERHIRGAAVPRINFHSVRHTHATLALQAGVHPKVISERLGHATVAITLDTYSHAIPAMEEEAAAKIAKVVFG